jgi:hypothetical protein
MGDNYTQLSFFGDLLECHAFAMPDGGIGYAVFEIDDSAPDKDPSRRPVTFGALTGFECESSPRGWAGALQALFEAHRCAVLVLHSDPSHL